MRAILNLLILLSLSACAPSPEEIAAARAAGRERHEDKFKITCIRKHGSPVVDENGIFKECHYPWSITIGKPQ